MDIDKINRKHFVETDMYYRIGKGLSSQLLNYRNGVISIEVVIRKKWSKDYTSTCTEIAYLWKHKHTELHQALACKMYIIDIKNNDYKKDLMQKGINPGYDARKGIIFSKNNLN